MSVELLITKQNADGGWPYVRGASWTEPTAYAILALLADGETRAVERGIRWMQSAQRPDGGWPPQLGVDQSTWVSALAALLPAERLGARAHQGAIQWLLGSSGEETTLVYRLRQWLLGNSMAPDQEFAGWPWAPGAAAWVGPTALTILALEKEEAARPSPSIRERIDSGRKFLLSRTCSDGGWNHGSARALGYELPSYPETTGMALLAMQGVRSGKIERALATAERFLGECRSTDAMNWLRLGLLVHGRLPADYCRRESPEPRTLPEASLEVLATNAEKGRGFWC
jgi:hypothetical protein